MAVSPKKRNRLRIYVKITTDFRTGESVHLWYISFMERRPAGVRLKNFFIT
jgi:hypothetical protein